MVRTVVGHCRLADARHVKGDTGQDLFVATVRFPQPREPGWSRLLGTTTPSPPPPATSDAGDTGADKAFPLFMVALGLVGMAGVVAVVALLPRRR